jgi:sporulation protein YlmC with PRC-barrel domain
VNVQQAPGQQQQSAQPAMTGAQAERLIGTDAVTANGDDIGEIENLLVEANGQVKAVVVEWGGFLGIGESRAAVPWDQVQLNEAGDQVTINMTRSEMEAMPTYNPDQPSVAGIDSDVRPFR